MSLLSIILRNLPTFSTLKTDDKLLVARKTPKLDGLLTVQKFLDEVKSSITWSTLTEKPTTFPPSTHGHPFSEITALPATIAGHGVTDVAASLTRSSIPLSAVMGENGSIVFVPSGSETVVDGNYIEFSSYGSGLPVERWTFRDVADPELTEIQIQTNWDDTIYIFSQQLNDSGTFVGSIFSTDGFGRSVLTLIPKIVATSFDATIDNYAGIAVTSEMPSGGDPEAETTEPSSIGQGCVVNHSDGTRSEWGASRVSPPEWLPRTAGIVKNRDTGVWERTFIASSTIQTEILPDQ